MSGQGIVSLLPIIILAAGMLLTMILVALKRNHKLAIIATLITLTTSLTCIFFITVNAPHFIGELFIIDRFGLYYQALILTATFVIAIFSYINLEHLFPDRRKEEYYLLLMLATFGSAVMVISAHFISFFVSLEILTVSLYALIGYYREYRPAIEAGLKYMVLAAMSSSFLLFGIALVYAVSGTLSFTGLATMPLTIGADNSIILISGVGMMMVGIGFKLAVVPFHMWAPDVYEGASSPVTAFIATVSKGSVLALLLRLFMLADLYRYEKLMLAFTIISVLSMLIGNLLALRQKNVKRILAYSSIANFGYLLVAFISGKGMGPQAATFYVTAYIITILGAFGIITIISRSDNEAADIENYKGLFWKRPFLAAAFTIFLLSLAGIPLTAGFIGKFFLLTAGLGKSQWLLAIVLVISSVIGLFYYLRLIATMMQRDNEYKPHTTFNAFSLLGGIIIAILAIAVVCLGIWPLWLVNAISTLI